MDLIAIATTVWRHKLASLPVIVLTFILAVYVVALKAPEYQATSSYVLINPPPPPTAAQVAKDPALGRLNSDNPYTSWGDLSIVEDVLTETLSTPAAKAELAQQDAGATVTAGPDLSFALGTPIIEFTAQGPTVAEVESAAKLAGQMMNSMLAQMQAAKGVSPLYRITTQQLTPPDNPQMQVSSKLRSLVAVLALGVILLFVLVSTAKALEERREARRQSAAPSDRESGVIVEPPVRGLHPMLRRNSRAHSLAEASRVGRNGAQGDPHVASPHDRETAG